MQQGNERDFSRAPRPVERGSRFSCNPDASPILRAERVEGDTLGNLSAAARPGSARTIPACRSGRPADRYRPGTVPNRRDPRRNALTTPNAVQRRVDSWVR